MADQAAASKHSIKPKIIGRYALFGEIAAGGMATVHFGRLVGSVGFSRTVAIKRLHPQYAKDPDFVAMFLDEARLASRVQHPNVVTTLDVVTMPNEVFLVMEYVAGESLSRLVKNARKDEGRIPEAHVAAMLAGMLHGLHAAHEAKSERREPLNIVHRDISPQNVLVGTDGVARVLDFGVAKAAMRSQSTKDGQMKGKLSYMSPEQLNGKPIDRRTDLFAAGVVLWEALTGKRLFDGADAGEIFAKVVAADIPEPKSIVPSLSESLNSVVMKSLERNPDHRFQTAREFAIAIEAAIPVATGRAVGEWVERNGGSDLERRLALVAEIESLSTNPEDLARLEQGVASEPAPLRELPEPTISAVQPVSGSRPRIPPPPVPPQKTIPDAEERSKPSVVTAPTLTSKITSVPQPVPAPAPAPALAPQSRPPGRSSAAVWVGALAACLAGGVLAFYLFGRPSARPTVIQGSTQAGATDDPSTAGAPIRPSPGAAAPGELPHAVDITDLPKAAPDDESAGRSAARYRGKAAAPGGPKPAAPGAGALCDPPFIVDANGIKRLKPGCL